MGSLDELLLHLGGSQALAGPRSVLELLECICEELGLAPACALGSSWPHTPGGARHGSAVGRGVPPLLEAACRGQLLELH